MTLPTKTRRRLDTQGYSDLDDETLAPLAGWMRMAFAGCALLAGIGTALASPVMLWALVPIAAAGAVFPVHPFDLIYNHGIRHLTGTGPLPRRPVQNRFACGMGSVWLVATALAFGSGAFVLGNVLGWSLTAVATLVATTHICLPSIVYNALFDRAHHDRARQS